MKEKDKIINLALKEDVGKQDITASIISLDTIAIAQIVCQESAIICGCELVNSLFVKIDEKIKISWFVRDGEKVKANTILCRLKGPARSLLIGERVSINFFQILSGTASITGQFVNKLKGTKVKLLDTRKTMPGLRDLQKYAVRCGGGNNHRFGLYDAILIKENHILACGSISSAVNSAKKKHPSKVIEVEVRNINELREALATKANIIMLDNFSLNKVRQAIKIIGGKVKVEVSGGINLYNIRAFAIDGVDYISVGIITKNAFSVEMSMNFLKIL